MAPPRRGEVWLIDFGQVGKTRPALVVSVAFGDQDRALLGAVRAGLVHDRALVERREPTRPRRVAREE